MAEHKIDPYANSQVSKDAQTEAEKHREIPRPVLSDAAKPKNSGLWGKIKSTFLQGRNPTDVAAFVITGVLLPAVIDGVANASKAAIDMALYGDTKINTQQNKLGVGVSRTNYSSLARQSQQNQPLGQNVTYGRTSYLTGFQNIPMVYSDAESVKNYIIEYICEYGRCSINEYYDACGEYAKGIDRRNNSILQKWGWNEDNLKNFEITVKRAPMSGLWIIDLPEPVAI